MHWWLNEWRAAWQSGVVWKSLLLNWNSFLTHRHPIQPPGSLLCARSQPQVVQAFCIIFLNASSSACACVCSWCERPHPVAVIICSGTCWVSPCQVDQHDYPGIKRIISTLRSHFFAPKMSLLWVYFSLPIKQMLPALRGIFCASQSLTGWNARCSRTLQSCSWMPGRWVDLPRQQERKSGLLSTVGMGVAAAWEWRDANTYRTDADKFQLLWKQLGAVERASDLEVDWPGLKSQMCHFSLWVELFANHKSL